MLCSKENSDERPLSRTTLDLLKQSLGMQRKASRVVRLESYVGTLLVSACVGF